MATLTYPLSPLGAILILHGELSGLFASAVLGHDQSLSLSLLAGPKIQVLPGLLPLKRDPPVHGSRTQTNNQTASTPPRPARTSAFKINSKVLVNARTFLCAGAAQSKERQVPCRDRQVLPPEHSPALQLKHSGSPSKETCCDLHMSPSGTRERTPNISSRRHWGCHVGGSSYGEMRLLEKSVP